MRFLSVYKPGKPESKQFVPPTREEMEAMGKLIAEMQQAGVLVTAEGCFPSAMGARVQGERSSYLVTDGPFAETKEIISGLCILRVASKEEAQEWAKRFLDVVGGGTCELLQLHEHPAA